MNELERITIGPRVSIREAMQAIDRGGVEIAMVVDDDRRMIGTLTDGDVRRALLGGATLEQPVDPYFQRKFRWVGERVSRNEVLDVMNAHAISQMPVLDQERRLVGLHLLRQLIGRTERPNWAVILAGGKGTRLGPITDKTPKPMIEVAGRPILERLILHLVGYGVRRIFLSVNYLADHIIDHFGDGRDLGCRISYLREEEPLGTAGPLGLLPAIPEHPVLVMNGDLLVNFDVAQQLEHHADKGAAITMGVVHYTHRIPFGVALVQDGFVERIEEKPVQDWLVNAAIYVLEPEVVRSVPGGQPLTMPELIQRTLSDGKRVAAYEVGERWADIGTQADLKRARGHI